MSNFDRVKTLNNMGYMFLEPDPALTNFLDHVERTQGRFADIGTAFGHATLEALKRGGQITAIDLDQRHLDILLEKCPTAHKSHLEAHCGHFPGTVNLPSNTYDGILFSRVLIFLTQNEISLALSKIYTSLKEGGIAYITAPCPLRKKWQPLRPIYETQKLGNEPWPGRIENLWDLMPEHKEILPNTIQLIDAPSLEQGLTQAGFKIETCAYYPTSDMSVEEAFTLTYSIASKNS
jgi:SAM-dependent methyltransferase